MKNRAKCLLCGSIIESFHSSDYVVCKCGEIAVSEGAAMRCAAKNFVNFLRVDDEGNEIVVKVKEGKKQETPTQEGVVEGNPPSLGKKELVKELDRMIENFESLPERAKQLPITYYDYCSLLMLLSAIFREDCKESS